MLFEWDYNKVEYDLSNAKRGAIVPANGKTRITIWLDDDVLNTFREKAESTGLGYQTLINQALRGSLSANTIFEEAQLRKIIREEIQANQKLA